MRLFLAELHDLWPAAAARHSSQRHPRLYEVTVPWRDLAQVLWVGVRRVPAFIVAVGSPQIEQGIPFRRIRTCHRHSSEQYRAPRFLAV